MWRLGASIKNAAFTVKNPFCYVIRYKLHGRGSLLRELSRAIIGGMMTNVSVERSGNESTASLLRRFSRKVQGSGVLPRVRSLRAKKRNKSKLAVKKNTLNVLRRREEVAKLIKLGKMPDKITTRRRN